MPLPASARVASRQSKRVGWSTKPSTLRGTPSSASSWSAMRRTGGTLAQMITAIPDASHWFRGWIVAYENSVKRELLGVPQALLDAKGAVSAEVAEAMAVGCRLRLGTDLALSTTGVAGPGSPAPDKPVGLVYVALAWDGGASTATFSWIGTRA